MKSKTNGKKDSSFYDKIIKMIMKKKGLEKLDMMVSVRRDIGYSYYGRTPKEVMDVVIKLVEFYFNNPKRTQNEQRHNSEVLH